MKRKALVTKRSADYEAMLDRVVRLIDEARRTSARSVNALMTATYWFIGRHIYNRWATEPKTGPHWKIAALVPHFEPMLGGDAVGVALNWGR